MALRIKKPNMKKIFLTIAVLGILAYSCTKKEDVDDVYPEIDIAFDGAFPLNCDTLQRGESFKVVVKLSDNKEL